MVDQKLSGEEEIRLKQSIGNLESAIETIYATRQPRNLFGEEGILVRTLGFDYQGPTRFQAQYFDKRRNQSVDTELSEVIEALSVYDNNPSTDNEVELLLEVGDIIFQRTVVNLRHKENEKYTDAIDKLDSALAYIKTELDTRNISFDKAEELVGIKYGTRAWLGQNNYIPKNKTLERKLCVEAYEGK
ncbi:hypothetical protein GOV14_03095 [Candidatus Pacearchaeota archaeon]|nr:hypothetical protein [Candidatus Pacearchaeota archaeon]